MTTIDCATLRDWARNLKSDLRGRQRRVRRAQRKAVLRAVPYMRQHTIPKAFGDLGDSIHTEATEGGGARLVVDAPHAAAVENGSRPHLVPIAALIAWVKLRGAQGLKSGKQLGKLRGTTTQSHARNVAQQIRDHERRNGSVDVDVPLQIAYAIQHAIAARGTKPQHYMAKTQPAILAFLDEAIADAMIPRDYT